MQCFKGYKHGQIRGGRGSGPPFIAHVVGFLTLGLKLDLDPPGTSFFACKPKMDPPPLSKILDPPLISIVIFQLQTFLERSA